MPLTIAVPFTGLDVVKRVADVYGLPLTLNNVIELNPHLSPYLSALHGRPIKPKDIKTELSKGNVQSADGVVMGPPCTGFTRIGSGSGWSCEDSQLMITAIDFAAELANDTRDIRLKFIVIENSPAVTQRGKDGSPPPIVDMNKRVEEKFKGKWMPLKPIPMNAHDYEHGLDRLRVFCVSFPKLFRDILDRAPGCPLPVPMPQPRQNKVSLYDVLDDFNPADEITKPSAYFNTVKMVKKYHTWKKAYAKVQAGTVAATDMSRDPKHTFNAKFTVDRCPSLTTRNYQIVVFGKSALQDPLKVSEHGKLLGVCERARLLGYEYADIQPFMSKCQAIKALGNGIAVNVMADLLKIIGSYVGDVIRIGMAKTVHIPDPDVRLHDIPDVSTGDQLQLAMKRVRKLRLLEGDLGVFSCRALPRPMFRATRKRKSSAIVFKWEPSVIFQDWISLSQ